MRHTGLGLVDLDPLSSALRRVPSHLLNYKYSILHILLEIELRILFVHKY